MTKALRCLTLSTVLMLSGAAVADAAAIRAGETSVAIAALTRGSTVAYDSVNRVYLVVSTYGMLRGRFVDREGRAIGEPFVIQSSGNFTHFPGVAFSPDADGGNGGFLVAWHENDLPTAAFVHARVVSVRAGGPVSAETVLTMELPFWEQAPAIAYSTASREFLVAWARYGWGIRAVRVDNNAAALAPVFTLSQINQNEGNPSASYTPTTNSFVVVWKGFDDASLSGYVDARLVQAGTNNLVGPGATRVGAGGGTYMTDIAYQSANNQFLVAWYKDGGGANKASLGRLLNADLTPGGTGNVIPISSLWKAYDALGVAYNPVTNTFFLISHDGRGLATSIEDGGVELDAAGNPIDNGFLVTAGAGKPNFYPKIAASTKEPTWIVTTAYGFESTRTQLVSSGGVQPVSSLPMLNIDVPGSPLVHQPFMMAGWGLDRGASSSNGADVVHVWAWPNNGGAPIFAGHTTINLLRPDLASAFGPQFGASGWGVTISNLPPGSYQLTAYLRSTITNSFSIAKVVPIIVLDPILTIDTPGNNSALPRSGFGLGGWAIDRGAPTGTGVDTLHVWSFPDGGAAQWVGVAEYGVARPDVAAAFGASRFTNSGYNVWVTLTTPGWHTVVVFSHSSVTDTFTAARTVRVFVQ